MPRRAATVLLLLSFFSAPAVAQTPTIPYRDDIVLMLQQLIATGYPVDNAHDRGEWLQGAVNYAIHVGDREIEALAVRAAVPLRARIDRPVSSTEAPACIQVLSYKVLTLPRPVAYVAYLQASLDDGPFVDLGKYGPEGECIALRYLGTAALRPGTHLVRLRAHLAFGDPQQPVHVEVRDLGPVAYALFDPDAARPADARRFIFGPAAFAASDLDALLPSRPFIEWLTRTLGDRGEIADSRMWLSRYCSELTEEHHGRHAGALCSVILVSLGGSMGQIWFRTGYVDISSAGVTWRAERPSLEALFFSDGRAASRLSALPALLEQPYDPNLRDTSIAKTDIAITPASPKPGAVAHAVITLHNRGDVTVNNLFLEVIHLDGATGGGWRHFVIDIPPNSSKSVSLEITFRSGYGLVLALPFVKDHGLVHDLVGAAPLDAPCVFRTVNIAAAPRGFVASMIGHMPQCTGR